MSLITFNTLQALVAIKKYDGRQHIWRCCYEFKRNEPEEQNNNYAKKNGIAAQVVLQNYMFERFLERLAQSVYQQ